MAFTQCLEKQQQKYGEYFWDRRWQLAGANCCLKHGELSSALLLRHGYHRHQFFPASPQLCGEKRLSSARQQDKAIAYQINALLSAEPSKSASFEQWSKYYKDIVVQAGLNRGCQIQYEAIVDKVVQHWSSEWLCSQGLKADGSQSCWLRSIFRKHRKAFSYLEHIVALSPFMEEEWQINDTIQEVKRLSCGEETDFRAESSNQVSKETGQKRTLWQALVSLDGPKAARQKSSALYAWLYRHDKTWLLTENVQHKIQRGQCAPKSDWQRRDRVTVRTLMAIRDNHEAMLDCPRQSKNWYLSKLKNKATIEKNQDKYPLVCMFLQHYCEDSEDFQIRRITNTLARYRYPEHKPERWQLLRSSGLSDERLKAITEHFLQDVLSYHAGNKL